MENYTYEKATSESINRVFAGDPKRKKRCKKYLEKGAEGHFLCDMGTWIGYSWSVALSGRVSGVFRPRRNMLIGLPQNYKVSHNAYWLFSTEINPCLSTKNIYPCLLKKIFEIHADVPGMVFYSRVDADDSSSIKSKMTIGEIPLGLYYTLNATIWGRQFKNIYCSPLINTFVTWRELRKRASLLLAGGMLSNL